MDNKYIKLLLKKIDGEFCVQYIEDGKINESKSYFTDCKKDAMETMELMNINVMLTNYFNGYKFPSIHDNK
tara:strand:+ start:126 stop:338 length:213 start_codon:yes stop_codon:yes gene_type:complete